MSVKTGAVGSNPKIDKLMNVDLASLERFASTTMLSQILQTDTLESGNGNSDVTVVETAEESRKTIQENRAKMSEPELPKEGIYLKDLDKGNIVARYKKAADERALQMEAACTLAFTEEEIMKRNGITEEERGEFFTSYLVLESEYLVEGAMLTCTQATEEMIIWPNSFIGDLSKTENALEQVENPANDGEKKYATVRDSIRVKNIGFFKNCKLAGSSSESKDKVNQSVKDCKAYGTCYALMDLCAEWVNVADGAVYGKADGELKICINMLSHLGCYQGGIIFPLNTGQGESEEEFTEEDLYELAVRYGAESYDIKYGFGDINLKELVARIIYGEQTNPKEQGQEAVAWTMINRLLSQNVKLYGQYGELTLKNALTKRKQYTAYIGEEKNIQAFTAKTPDGNKAVWDGWLNAVRLGHHLTETFGENSTMDLSDEELNDIKNELIESIGESPIGNGVYYRAKEAFDDNHTQIGDKHYIYGVEIKPGYKDCKGNTYFDYVN